MAEITVESQAHLEVKVMAKNLMWEITLYGRLQTGMKKMANKRKN